MLNILILISGILGATLLAFGLFVFGYSFLILNSLLLAYYNRYNKMQLILFIYLLFVACFGLINLGIK
jgi:hypothetical protein